MDHGRQWDLVPRHLLGRESREDGPRSDHRSHLFAALLVVVLSMLGLLHGCEYPHVWHVQGPAAVAFYRSGDGVELLAMKARSLRLLVLVPVCTIAALVVVALSARPSKVVRQRMQDVESLTRLYFRELQKVDFNADLVPIKDTSDLLRAAQASGIKLHNPITEDPSKPCYRLVYAPNDPKARILIEETNTTDHQHVVRSTTAGSVFMQNQ